MLQVQEARIEEVKADTLAKTGRCEICDKGGNTIDDELHKRYNMSTSEHYEMTQEDILISTLITIAPKKDYCFGVP